MANVDIDGLLKILFVFLLAFVPSLIWLSIYLRKDPRPEPRRLIFFTFIFGGAMTIIGSLAENQWFKSFVQDNANEYIGMLLFLFFYPFLEEILKFLAARLSTIKSKAFKDEVSDPMIYMITAALGFAAFENVKIYLATIFGEIGLLTWQGIFHMSFSQDILISLLLTASIRFVATVFLHSLSSGMIGYFWSMQRICKHKISISFVAFPAGILLATVLHSFFNYLIMNISEGGLYVIILAIFLTISGVIVSRALRQTELLC